MGKNKKKMSAKERARLRLKKKKRDQERSPITGPAVQYVKNPPISEIEAPPGFMAISMAQSMIEYAKPLTDYVEQGVIKDIKQAFSLAQNLWNYEISLKDGGRLRIEHSDLLRDIESALNYSASEAAEFLDMMVQRKRHLFPDSIQPDYPLIMFMRKEQHYLITEFNYDNLKLSEKNYSIKAADTKLVALLNELDSFIVDFADYDDWEDLYFTINEKCKERYKNWLEFRELDDFAGDFSDNIEVYLNFIYQYAHVDPVHLKNITYAIIEEFFLDNLLRKMSAEPNEYVTWPPALKLFYLFLKDIGYLEKPEPIIRLFDKIEPVFINMLKERYS